MTRRPMLILNGKATRYKTLYVVLCKIGFIGFHHTSPMAKVDSCVYYDIKVSTSTRPSGRRVIWVHTEVEDGMD